MKNLIIGAHACNQECLAGGTALKHLRKGHKVIMITLTRNDKIRSGYSPEETCSATIREVKRSSQILGIEIKPKSQTILNNTPSPIDEFSGARATAMARKALDAIRTNKPQNIEISEYYYNYK